MQGDFNFASCESSPTTTTQQLVEVYLASISSTIATHAYPARQNGTSVAIYAFETAVNFLMYSPSSSENSSDPAATA